MGSVWEDRLGLRRDFIAAKEGFIAACREHTLLLKAFRQLTKFQPQVDEILLNSRTRESGRILRIVPNEQIRDNASQGVCYVVAVPSVSPKREELWTDSEVVRDHQNR